MTQTNSLTKHSYHSTMTLKPSFFYSSLEGFPKCSILKKSNGMHTTEIYDLAQLNVEGKDVDPRLKNWEKWLNIHKQQQDRLSATLKRPPKCLAMNSNLDKLYVNQEKRVITDATNFEYCDKYRGHPNFWKVDNMNNDGKSVGVYQTIQQKYDRSRKSSDECGGPLPVKKEYVSVPAVIFKEKGLCGRETDCLPSLEQKWQKSSYVAEKKECLKEKLQIIQEHLPKLSDVAVIGVGCYKNKVEPSKPVEEGEGTNKNTVESIKPTEQVDCKSFCSESLFAGSTDFELLQKSKIVLIGDKIMPEDSKLWTVYFEDCLLNETCEKSITINNLGESSLRYSWQIVSPHWVGNDLPLKHVRTRSKCFYFDKSDGVILPDHNQKLVFYFKPIVVGVFCERWKLLLSHAPDNWESVTVELQAVATESLESIENLKSIDSYIESCTRYTIASKTVKTVLKKSRAERPQELPYDWKFFEEQIFIHNNPDLFYDNKNVFLLKSLHEKVVGGPWDFSVQNLRKQLLQKSSNEDMTTELETYVSTVYQLMKPNLATPLKNEKHKSVYELLCCFINKLESEGSKLKFIYRIPINLKYSGGSQNDEINITPSLLSGIKQPSLSGIKPSLFSGKLSGKASQLSKKSLGKKTLSKSKSSLNKSFTTVGSSLSSITFSRQTSSVSTDLNQISNNDEHEIKRRKQEYLEALYVMTYDHLCHTLDHISSVIQSFEAHQKKTVLNILKHRKT